MVLSDNLFKGMYALGDKMTHVVKYTLANGYQHGKYS
jgi:hypothetical protein